ncbi:hypothetical protein C1637_00910 [Chryseobacterium lactis]|uniref:Tetratricopeptide repeat protein n=1 Tax=Chryseobacterium lactis TaxID=1241981 RepID=A0A3G6RQQ3_CHRLC|nr:hypothetical protein [Chryseobacterium lactis]AZA81172.1 hypothetical protein EG342_04295 [Chryseobacterium lactis]AZB06173.1 hypothetical protein EG341_20420 [Chryseobacterium lactis]PNW15023.1 hypothetical protein C1637_00910 [Chryseobacterium lactis]
MNPRVLELIKNPKNIQLEDLGLLKEEIHAFPYIQNIRALHLYGVHLYEKENYQKELSTTAAYTTDKKILYQLINGKVLQESKPEPVEEKQITKTVDKPLYPYKGFPIKREDSPSEKQEEDNSCVFQPPQEVKHIYVNGERNRILFEGEENFLEEKNNDIIDLESTLESGTIVTQKSEPAQEEKELIQSEVEENAGEEFTPETIINEDEISSEGQEEKVEEEENISFHETEVLLPETIIEEDTTEKPVEVEVIPTEDIAASTSEEIEIEPDAELSFHKTEEFLPDVKMQVSSEEAIGAPEASQSGVNKHEEEMRRLIEEVEKKMKETKSAPQEEKAEPEIVEDHEISFAETQHFHFWSTGQEEDPKPEEIKTEPAQEEVVESHEPVQEAIEEEVSEEKEVPEAEVQSSWKPMSLESNVPDSLIHKTTEVPTPVAKTSEEEIISAPVADTEVEDEVLIEEPLAAAEISQEEPVSEIEETSEPVEEPSEVIEEAKEVSPVAKLKEEAPVMNVSFFGSDISTLNVEQKQSKEEPVEKENVQEAIMKNTQSPTDSNVPGFINTWQSWLKIGKTDDPEKEKAEIKEKAIENFIEKNPRISQLKDESTYVVKEKNDDISHLMTETLANLYFEQKLYTKAIKAFDILIRKTPEKKEYFESRIKEIKDFRSKN